MYFVFLLFIQIEIFFKLSGLHLTQKTHVQQSDYRVEACVCGSLDERGIGNRPEF